MTILDSIQKIDIHVYQYESKMPVSFCLSKWMVFYSIDSYISNGAQQPIQSTWIEAISLQLDDVCGLASSI